MTRNFVIFLGICAICVMKVSGDLKEQARERRVRELRPRFVKRAEQAPLVHAGNPDERVDEEYIVKLRDDLTEDDLAAFEETFQELCEKNGMHIDFHGDIKALMRGFTARVPGDAVEILRWMDEVEFVEEDEQVHAVDVPWGLDRIDQSDLPLDNVFESPLGNGSGVNVFVVDTGILFSHSEFEGRASNFIDLLYDGKMREDCIWHGTHCAGTIGGKTVGVAPGVTLYGCRVLNCFGSGSASRTIAAMDTIANSGIKPGVVSMSLSGGRSTLQNLAVARLTEMGYIVVVAAGNSAQDASNESPASAEEAITVGATNSRDEFAWYSNFGNSVNILAPGSDVLSAWITSNDAYGIMSGTSMATPHVAGVAALLLELNSTLTQTQVSELLLSSAKQDRIDMSIVPDEYQEETPDKLLNIPGLDAI
ncbi:extracellular serine proteinase-like [Ptychodera flava]|uniref:extracellular serine proteinase-like n=1 Tax=Ptychodera flava TaxID=63121 RepID=UPI00396A8FEF